MNMWAENTQFELFRQNFFVFKHHAFQQSRHDRYFKVMNHSAKCEPYKTSFPKEQWKTN